MYLLKSRTKQKYHLTVQRAELLTLTLPRIVQPKHFTTLTYTFNSTKKSLATVDGEI